jgi:formylglycine-generating enzyme required for sulfatase activity
VSRGNFVSGGSRSADERPLVVRHLTHPVRVARRPVTNGEYAVFEAAHPRPRSVDYLSHWRLGKCPDALRDHPVHNLRPEDADAYAAWAGARLPTADEWEKAVRGWDGRNFPWGDVADPTRANTAEAGRDTTCPVDAHPQGALYGAIGDAFEYTSTWYRDRPDRGRVAMGGGYAHTALRASLRLSHTLSGRLRCGLRLAEDDRA